MPRLLQPPLPVEVSSIVPLSTIETARVALAALEYTEKDVLADLDEGAFEWAWNIGGPDALRREVRIFTPCVEQRRLKLLNPKWNVKRYDFGDVARALFPMRGNKPFVHSPDLRLAFNCTPKHITTLIDDGVLTQSNGTEYSVGRNGAANICWDSVKRFLNNNPPKGRRI